MKVKLSASVCVLGCGISLILLSWIAFLLIDIHESATLRALLQEHVGHSIFFLWFFIQNGPIEIMQWTFNFVSLYFCFKVAFRLKRTGMQAKANYLAVFGVGLSLMLLEDIVDVRLFVGYYLQLLILGNVDFYNHFIRTAVSGGWYMCIALFISVPLLAMFRQSIILPPSRSWFSIFFCCYFVAAVSSATEMVGHWYILTGDRVLAKTNPNLNEVFLESARYELLHVAPLGFWFMDFLYEESLEYLGALSLLVGMISLGKNVPKSNAI